MTRSVLRNKGLLEHTAVETKLAEEERANFRVSGERKNSNYSASLPFSLSEGKNVGNQDKFSDGRRGDILTKRSIGHSGTHIYCYVHAAQTEERIGNGRVENGKV